MGPRSPGMRVDGHHSWAPDTCLLRPQESLSILCKLMRLASGWGFGRQSPRKDQKVRTSSPIPNLWGGERDRRSCLTLGHRWSVGCPYSHIPPLSPHTFNTVYPDLKDLGTGPHLSVNIDGPDLPCLRLHLRPTSLRITHFPGLHLCYAQLSLCPDASPHPTSETMTLRNTMILWTRKIENDTAN